MPGAQDATGATARLHRAPSHLMLRIKNLGSGSTGNATVVEAGFGAHRRRMLVDCGLGLRQVHARLSLAKIEPESLNALFITHEHSDHVGCALKFAARYRIPVWMSEGTYAAIGAPDLDGLLRIAHDLVEIDLGALQVRPFTVPHDAREPLQVRCTDGASHLAILTDLGHATSHVLEQITGCHALMLEANHDPDLLAASRYPEFLKRRVGGPSGHLANEASAGILGHVQHAGLQHVIAAHLSTQNNQPLLAQQAMATALGWQPQDIVVACPTHGTSWITLA